MTAGSAVRLALKCLVVVGFVAGLWLVEPTAGPRLLTVTVGAGYLIGIVAAHGAPRHSPRLPVAVQGLVVGLVVGVAVGTIVLTEVPRSAFGLMFLVLVLPTQFPAVLPGRWRRAVTARWSDLAAEPEPWR